MSLYYTGKRSRNLFEQKSKDPFTISRSKLDVFLNCERCSYLDLRLGVGRPPGFPFTLNNAVDELMKREFDLHRAKGTVHPIAKAYGLQAVPLEHPDLGAWRDALKRGIKYHDSESNFILRGGIDDVWKDENGDLIIVDYKATSKKTGVSLDADWQISYKRQMEVYQWLFEKNGFSVSKTGYFVYANGNSDAASFDGKLEFDLTLLPYTGDSVWIPEALMRLRALLESTVIPKASTECDYCTYRDAAGKTFLSHAKEHIKKQVK